MDRKQLCTATMSEQQSLMNQSTEIGHFGDNCNASLPISDYFYYSSSQLISGEMKTNNTLKMSPQINWFHTCC